MHRLLVLGILTGLQLCCASKPPTVQSSVPDMAPAKQSAGKEKKTTAFDGNRAFSHVKAQVDFGPRPAGSSALEKTRQYILAELKSYGLKTSLDEFTAPTPAGKIRFKNLIAELPGETADTIILASHYDTKPFKEFSFLGANDGGSSTGALIEIARIMAGEKRKTRFTYQFVFFDGEEAFCREWGQCLGGKDNTYGSRHMVNRLKDQGLLSSIKALILLDMIGDKNLQLPKCDESSSWLVQTIWNEARKAGHAEHFLERTQSMIDDHIPFLEAGIPSADIIDFEYGSGEDDNSFWHTEKDTLDKISPDSLKTVGDVLLLSLPAIESQIR